MPEYNMVSDIESALEDGLQVLFGNLDDVAVKWQTDPYQILEQLRLSIADLDIAHEYSNWIADGWYAE